MAVVLSTRSVATTLPGPAPVSPALVRRGRRRGRLAAWALMSLSFHLLLAAAWLSWAIQIERDELGSQELDVELVAPRLAPPPVSNEGPDAALAARRATAAGSSAPAAAGAGPSGAAKPSARATARAGDPAPPVGRNQTRRSPEQRRVQRHPQRPPAMALVQLGPREMHTGELAEQPDAVDPTSLLAAVERDMQQRRQRQQRWLAAQQARQQRLQQRWARFIASSGEAPAGASAAGAAGPAGRTAAGDARQGEGDGDGRRRLRYGLRFYLSGQQRETSKVVRPPELIAFPELACRVHDLNVTPATVRTLVTMEGTIGLAYIRHSSKNSPFDRCALQQVQGLRFKPGTDLAGNPLNVWVHIRVAPGLPQTVL